eukprot:TRINITY_DN556_c0_g1_i6.p1 TRINITY_DN556_c0_g1~~TRINITY_DN556_c0_g1_i6.p1  ORF type:complete len:410 (-),score=43.49 TRINITY_DN556_c0_g1_i6:490-1719(-)
MTKNNSIQGNQKNPCNPNRKSTGETLIQTKVKSKGRPEKQPTMMFVSYVALAIVLFGKVQLENAGASMVERSMDMYKVYESTDSLRVPSSVFSPPLHGQEEQVIIRLRLGSEHKVEAFQGKLLDDSITDFRTEGFDPTMIETEMKDALRNLKGSASFLEDGADFDDNRQLIELIGKFPWTAIGYLEMQECIRGFCNQVTSCTATLIQKNIAITAAHCVYDLEQDAQGKAYGFYDKYYFYPGKSGDEEPLGRFEVVDASVGGKWAQGNLSFDYAAIILSQAEDGSWPGQKAGWLGITVDCYEVEAYTLNIAGYPMDLSDSGDVMYYALCDDVFLDACSSETRLFDYQCTTARGMSGAPLWVLKRDKGNRRELRGIHSRGLATKSQGVFIDETIFKFVKREIDLQNPIVGN